ADGAARGIEAAFAQLQDSKGKFEANLSALSEGGELSGGSVPAAPAAAQDVLAEVQKYWNSSDKSASGAERVAVLISAKTDLINLGKNVSAISAGSSQLAEVSE